MDTPIARNDSGLEPKVNVKRTRQNHINVNDSDQYVKSRITINCNICSDQGRIPAGFGKTYLIPCRRCNPKNYIIYKAVNPFSNKIQNGPKHSKLKPKQSQRKRKRNIKSPKNNTLLTSFFVHKPPKKKFKDISFVHGKESAK